MEENQATMKMELKKSTTQLENGGKSFKSRIDQVKGKIQDMRTKYRNWITEEKNLKNRCEKHAGIVGQYEKTKFLIIGIEEE